MRLPQAFRGRVGSSGSSTSVSGPFAFEASTPAEAHTNP